jgi:redox-sensing transcriptional repressor
MRPRISDSTVRRLSAYLRVLEDCAREHEEIVSSSDLAERAGVTSAQVRKDLAAFGSFGRRGFGYEVAGLRQELLEILGLTRRWRVALVGAGNIGTALFSYKEFPRQGFDVVAIFDDSHDRIGHRLGDLVIDPMNRFAAVCTERRVEIGVIATPARAAQEVAERMSDAGLRAILNFAPRKLQVPRGVALRNVNLAYELESLSFLMRQQEGRTPTRGTAIRGSRTRTPRRGDAQGAA